MALKKGIFFSFTIDFVWVNSILVTLLSSGGFHFFSIDPKRYTLACLIYFGDVNMHDDFLFSENLSELDPKLHELIQIETERQFKKLIFIPGESYGLPRREKLWDLFFRMTMLKGILLEQNVG